MSRKKQKKIERREANSNERNESIIILNMYDKYMHEKCHKVFHTLSFVDILYLDFQCIHTSMHWSAGRLHRYLVEFHVQNAIGILDVRC